MNTYINNNKFAMKDNILYYVCPNWDYPELDSDDYIELEMPLYEDVPLSKSIQRLDLYGMEDLMSLYSFAGERCYFSLDITKMKEYLIQVVDVNTSINNGIAHIEYKFEDGSLYIPERVFQIEDDLSENDLITIVELAKEATCHIYKVSCRITGRMLSFEKELWG